MRRGVPIVNEACLVGGHRWPRSGRRCAFGHAVHVLLQFARPRRVTVMRPGPATRGTPDNKSHHDTQDIRSVKSDARPDQPSEPARVNTASPKPQAKQGASRPSRRATAAGRVNHRAAKLRHGGPSVRAGRLMARRRAVGPGVSSV